MTLKGEEKMAEEGKKPRPTAYLLLTFDLDSQHLISSEGALDDRKNFQPVKVDWLRLLATIRKKKPLPDPPDPPWGRPVVDEDHEHRGTPPWKASAYDESAESDETPPEV